MLVEPLVMPDWSFSSSILKTGPSTSCIWRPSILELQFRNHGNERVRLGISPTVFEQLQSYGRHIRSQADGTDTKGTHTSEVKLRCAFLGVVHFCHNHTSASLETITLSASSRIALPSSASRLVADQNAPQAHQSKSYFVRDLLK